MDRNAGSQNHRLFPALDSGSASHLRPARSQRPSPSSRKRSVAINNDPIFEVVDVQRLDVRREKGGLFFERDAEMRRLKSNPVGKRCGVYIFCTLRGNRLIPWYVGKATKSFFKETFSPRNEALFFRALQMSGCEKAQVYFVSPEVKRGKPNIRAIAKMETYLIQQCSLVNDLLLNKQNRKFFSQEFAE